MITRVTSGLRDSARGESPCWLAYLRCVTLRYGALTVYYDDRILSPRWAAIKLARNVHLLDRGP